MSNRYKKKESDCINPAIMILLLLFLAPVVPFTMFITGVCYLIKIKGKYLVYLSFAVCGFLLFFQRYMLLHFFEEFKMGVIEVVRCLAQANLLAVISSYQHYSPFSFLVMVLIALCMSGCFISALNKKEKFKKPGINSIHAKVNEVSKNVFVPNKIMGEKTYIGRSQDNKKIYTDDDMKHMLVAGTTGSGKTVLLSNYIMSAIKKDYGLLIIDGKGDTGNGSILEITKELCLQNNKQLYIVNMNSPDTSSKYNPFHGANETVIKDMLINMTNWSEEHYKTNTERYLQRIIKLMKMRQEKLSFFEITKFLDSSKLKELSSQLQEDDLITKEEHLQNLEIIKSSGKIAESASARFATIAEAEIGKIFDGGDLDIYKAMQERAVILFVLNPLEYPETSSLLGRLVLIDAKKAVSKMFHGSYYRKFFIFDEINVYASTVLLDLINKSRSAGVTCFCATQSLADLESAVSEAFENQIIENSNNYIVMRQNSYDGAEKWAKTLGTKEVMRMTYQIGDFEADESQKGSARKTREFLAHPDDIKNLRLGEAFFLSHDINQFEKVNINKPF